MAPDLYIAVGISGAPSFPIHFRRTYSLRALFDPSSIHALPAPSLSVGAMRICRACYVLPDSPACCCAIGSQLPSVLIASQQARSSIWRA